MKCQKFGKGKEGHVFVTKEDFEREVRIQKKASKLGLAPKVIDLWSTDKGGVIIMEPVKETAYRLILNLKTEKEADKLLNIILDKIEELHRAGITHGDAHTRNIMFTKKDIEDSDLRFIDFRRSEISTQEKSEDYKSLLLDINVIIDTITTACEISKTDREFLEKIKKDYNLNLKKCRQILPILEYIREKYVQFGTGIIFNKYRNAEN